MKPIVVRRRHGLGLAGARRRAEAIAHRLQDEHGGSFEWDGDTLRFKRTGVSGLAAVTSDEVEVRVDVGVLLLPFRARIEREIRTFLDGGLGTAAGRERRRSGRLSASPEAPIRPPRPRGP
jgi:putative polyhydroxyalkanoate system protein